MFTSAAIRALQRRRRAGEGAVPLVDDRPGCAFGLVLRRAVDDLGKDFDRLEAKVNAVLFGVAATLLVELWRGWR